MTREEAIEEVVGIISGIVLEWCGEEQHWQPVGEENAKTIVRALNSAGWSWVKE